MTKVHWLTVCYRERKYRIATHGEHDTINRSLSKGHFYEEDLLTAVADLNRAGTYVDVGTHIGNHALFFANECPSTSVIGFEPWEPSYSLALRTMKANGVESKVHIYNCPVSGVDGSMVSFVPPSSGSNTGIGYAKKGGNIQSVSMDRAVLRAARNKPVALVKIDVEGFEKEVLLGASRTIERWRPVVAIETKTNDTRLQIDHHMTVVLGYRWAGRYGATPTQLYKP